jgi:aryl-alcohol dehydrogenase-like predicted oxidoreductase
MPENQRKLEIVDQLVELANGAGLTLIELAIGFVLSHRAVTSPIIGPRTMDHLEPLLKAADVRLSFEILDRIDEIVPPGLNVNRADGGYVPPSLADASLRRR